MSNEADAQTIQKTQKLLGKYIKKPPLTEKLLKKPPFRFLHDIVNSVIRETGFLKGLYSERELVSENVKEKDDKITFLNKLIEATKAITGIELSIRASKVIAGLESAETNLLLQAIGTALDKKLDSSQYISQLRSEKKSKSHTNVQINDKKAKHDKTKEKQEDKKKVSTTTTKNAGRTTDRSKGTKVPSSKDSMESTRNEKAKTKVKKPKEKTITPREKVIKTVKVKDVKEVIKEKDTNTQDTLDIENKDTIKEEKFEPPIIKVNTLQKEELDNELLGHQKVAISSNDENIMQATSENLFNYEQHIEIPASNDALTKKKDEETNEFVAPKETKPERLKSARPKTGALKADKEIVPPISTESIKEITQPALIQPVDNQNNDKPYIRPRSSLRPPSVRPSSARPGAPRLRNDTSLPEGEVIPLGKVNVIVESYNNKDLDEEETVTIQTAPELDYPTPILQLPTDKGHLVEQILEQIQQSDVVEHTKPAVNIEWEQDGFRSRNAANKEIEQLKAAIQTLTRTANPLGKLVNYLHEDIEAMHSELDMWINSARQIMVDVANQKRISDESNKPLQIQLEEIEDNITKHQQQIVTVHGNILRNEQRIQDLLVK